MLRVALGIWILSAVVCVGRGHPHAGHGTESQDTVVDNSVSLVNSANKEFAFRLYRKLAAHADSQGKNVFFSPVSVSVALSALSVGAKGETHKQLFSGLGFNTSHLMQTDVDRAFHALLEKGSDTTHEDTSEGTAVFVDKRFKPREEFLDALKQSYFAEGFSVDFTKSEESANKINEYVSEKTHGKIEKLVESLDASTVMYLISYIYFKGMWATPFNPDLTRADTFNVNENEKVSVQMMNSEDSFHAYYDQAINTSVLHLPFNSSYSMLLMLPDDMATLENAICPGHVNKWLKWMSKGRYDVYVPKFSIKSSYKLNDVLTEMGMSDMFTDRANLTGISETKLAVSEVVHQATLDVDEAGATATAATGIGITLMSLQFTPVLKFDRPFMVAITERNAGNILFLGKIINPVSVLVPGAGLGRLAWEIARLGYVCQGNEWSFFMLFSSNFVLNRDSAENQADLSKHRITHILNAAHSKRKGPPDIYQRMNITYMGIEAHDSCNFDMSVHFQAAADFINRALSKGGTVLVHCHVGVSRSATLVLAYLMLKHNLTLVEAICAVKDNRGVIPNRGFLRQLITLDGQLFGKHC